MTTVSHAGICVGKDLESWEYLFCDFLHGRLIPSVVSLATALEGSMRKWSAELEETLAARPALCCHVRFASEALKRWRQKEPTLENARMEGAVVSETHWVEQDFKRIWPRGYAYKEQRDGKCKLYLLAKVKDPYRVAEDYKRAKSRLRAQLTPHGYFWELPYGDLGAVASFIGSFGPLTGELSEILNDEFCWIDLEDFWKKQRRFKLITKLWITYERTDTLRNCWSELCACIGELDRAEDFPIGSLPFHDGFRQVRKPWERPPFGGNLARWIREVTPETLRRESNLLIHCELNSQLREWRPVWRAQDRPKGDQLRTSERPQYQMVVERTDCLWKELWYMFALDTAAPRGWRICPHCDRIFYPPRNDRWYCTSELQVEYSKRKWREKNEIRNRSNARKKAV